MLVTGRFVGSKKCILKPNIDRLAMYNSRAGNSGLASHTIMWVLQMILHECPICSLHIALCKFGVLWSWYLSGITESLLYYSQGMASLTLCTQQLARHQLQTPGLSSRQISRESWTCCWSMTFWLLYDLYSMSAFAFKRVLATEDSDNVWYPFI